MTDAPPPGNGSNGSDGSVPPPPPPPPPPGPPTTPPPPGEPPFIPPMYRGGMPRGPWGIAIIAIVVLAGATLVVWAIGAATGAFAR